MASLSNHYPDSDKKKKFECSQTKMYKLAGIKVNTVSSGVTTMKSFPNKRFAPWIISRGTNRIYQAQIKIFLIN